MRLDKLDARIIELLQHDARMMYKDIANQVGVSLPTVRARIRRLLDFGVLKKFTAIVDPNRLYGRLRALLLIQASPKDVERVAQRLGELKEIREVYVAAGAYSLVAKAEVGSLTELGDLTTTKLPAVEGLTAVSTLVITHAPKEEYGGIVEPETVIQLRCEFCGGAVVERPHIESINGVRFYFTGPECAEAYKQRLERKGRLQVATQAR